MNHNQHKRASAQEIKKPFLTGCWHGRDAYRLGIKVMMSMIASIIICFFLGAMLTFDSLLLRVLFSTALLTLFFLYMRSQGIAAGLKDATHAEIMYQRQEAEKLVLQSEQERCYHPWKGVFAALIGAMPYMALTLVFALLTQPSLYTLGELPGWLRDICRQSEFGNALRYYNLRNGITLFDILRVLCRAMIMPYINVAVLIGDDAILLIERASPILILLMPAGFAFGYLRGIKARAHINASIAIGVEMKRRKERREKRRRASDNAPKRLI